jgi:hypothetical protein
MMSGTGRDTSATEGLPPSGVRTPVPNTLWGELKTLPAIARFLWRSSKGYRLRPWASPYLRWRIETYWGWHADQIDARRFWAFTWRQRRALWRFLLWAANMASQQHYRLHP